jgi:glycine/D-amino acid oxidase-like deaminating enzyme
MPIRDPEVDLSQASGWYAILPKPPPARRLSGHQVADWVVIGAGVTGLAAARRLGELAPNARVVLIDDYRIGYGASGRNSGFIIDTPHLSERVATEQNQRLSRLVVAGLAELEGLVRKHQIECEWSPRGHLTAIVERQRIENLEATARSLDAVNEGYEWLEGDALARVIGTRHYYAAINTPRTVLVNPAAMCRGLGDTLPVNVEVYEETPVHSVRPGSMVQVECTEGSISAPNVLLTTNAFVTKLGFLKRHVFPLFECASLSRPLTADERAMMGGAADWGITGFASMRRTLSNRILIRHGTYYGSQFRLTQGMRTWLQGAHKTGMLKRFPMLGNLEFEHTWSGVYCMTRNWASYFGRLEPGLFASLGYSGVGVPRGTISGKLLAEYALGFESALIDDVRAVSGPPRLPPEPFLGLGVRARLAWHRFSNRAEW